MLAVLGAEFGHEVLPTKRGVDEVKKGKKGLEGFTLSNYSLAHHTSKLYCMYRSYDLIFMFQSAVLRPNYCLFVCLYVCL